jgi:hypothetical protein
MKFIDSSGAEQSINGIPAYLKAVESGQLRADSMVFEDGSGKWVRAEETAEFRSLALRKSADSAAAERKRARQLRVTGWALATMAPLLAVLVSGTFDGGFLAGQRLGEASAVLLLLALPLYFGFRKASDLRKAMATAVVGASLAVWMAIAVFQDWRGVRQKAELRAVAADVSAQIQSGARGSDRTGSASNSAPEGEFARLLASVPARMAQNEAGARAFEESAAALRIGEVLTPSALITGRGIESGRKTLSRYEELVESYVESNRRYVETLTAEVADMNLSPSERAEFNAGYASGLVRSGELLGQWVRLQTKQIAKSRELLDLADSLAGTLTVSDGALMFSAQKDLDTYNRLLGELQSLAEQETALAEEQAKRVRERQEQLQKMSGER